MKNCSLYWLFAALLMPAGIGTIESRGQPLPESPQATAVTHSIILNSYSTTRQFIRSWTNAETGRLLTRTNQSVPFLDDPLSGGICFIAAGDPDSFRGSSEGAVGDGHWCCDGNPRCICR